MDARNALTDGQMQARLAALLANAMPDARERAKRIHREAARDGLAASAVLSKQIEMLERKQF